MRHSAGLPHSPFRWGSWGEKGWHPLDRGRPVRWRVWDGSEPGTDIGSVVPCLWSEAYAYVTVGLPLGSMNKWRVPRVLPFLRCPSFRLSSRLLAIEEGACRYTSAAFYYGHLFLEGYVP